MSIYCEADISITIIWGKLVFANSSKLCLNKTFLEIRQNEL